MNGQMHQICRIAAAARKALSTRSAIAYAPVNYENAIEFQFLPERTLLRTRKYKAENVLSWFEHCRKKGLQDIKVLFPVSVEDRGILGFSNTTQSSIVCFWSEKVTFFTPHWDFASIHQSWHILYTEREWSNAPAGKPGFENNREEFAKTLAEITELARKINCDYFASIFQKASDILSGSSDYTDAAHGLPLPEIPEERLRLFEAASTADVFGAMGSWNDSPPLMARDKGLSGEYDRLSDALLTQIRLAILYAINEW